MDQSLRSTESSLENDPTSSDDILQQRLCISEFDDDYSDFKEATYHLNDWEVLHRNLDSRSLKSINANHIEQAKMQSIGFDNTGITAHNLLPLKFTPQPSRMTDEGQLCDGNLAIPVEEPSITPVLLNQPHASQQISAPTQTHYAPYLGRFSSSEHAKAYRRDKMRFGRMPWRDPESDPTIAETENNRDFHVKRIYNAMICGAFARDNANSTGLKRWVYGAHYQSDLVEAYAHKVFDCLLEQVKNGFRGWHQNDYVNDERKGDDDDKAIDCAGRLDNIITALQQEKSICENVMSSAWQIRMFVNAPKAYAKRKDQNRVGNSKRPNTKTSEMVETGTRSSKRPRNAATMQSQSVRGGSTARQSRPPVTTTLQRQHKQPLHPTGNSPQNTSETSGMLPVSSSPNPNGDSSLQQAHIVLPSPNLSPLDLHTSLLHNLQHSVPMPSLQQRRALKPPRSYNNVPESSAFIMTRPATIAPKFLGWLSQPDFRFSPSTPPQLELGTNAVSEESQQHTQPFPPCDTIDRSNTLDCYEESRVILSDVEPIPFNGMDVIQQDDFFDGFWNLQETDVLKALDTSYEQSTTDSTFL